jgi:hypothetical protein
MTTCLNCGHSFKGNFCSNCGQKATAKRITASVLVTDVIHFFTHVENGFLFTTWSFLIRPGVSSLNYLKGKRKEFQTPASFFLIWTGLYILLHNAVIKFFHLELAGAAISQFNIREQSNILFRNHFSLFIIPIIFFSAFLIYLFLAKPRYNFVELLTVSLFGAGNYFMMCFISDFVLGFIFRMNILSLNVFLWQTLLSTAYNFWFCFDLFKRLHLRFFWLRLFSVSILIALFGLAMMLYLPIAWMHVAG